MDFLFVVLGIVLLYFGGNLLVSNASTLAARFGLTPMVIGLTVVAFGTSAPELAASITAALAGSPEIAVGNVLGSNIANVGLILAVAALVSPVRTKARFLRREMPILIAVSLLLVLLLQDGYLGRWEGALLLGLLVVYLVLLLRTGSETPVEQEFEEAYGAAESEVSKPLWRNLLGLLIGLALLVLGARLLVEGATSLARAAGIPELLIGLTVVAVGTSLPELAASVIAALRKQPEIALGNVVGSNILNILGILGTTVLVRPIEIPFGDIAPDLWAMLIASLLLWPFLITGRRLGRREATLLLLLYGTFLAYRFLN